MPKPCPGQLFTQFSLLTECRRTMRTCAAAAGGRRTSVKSLRGGAAGQNRASGFLIARFDPPSARTHRGYRAQSRPCRGRWDGCWFPCGTPPTGACWTAPRSAAPPPHAQLVSKLSSCASTPVSWSPQGRRPAADPGEKVSRAHSGDAKDYSVLENRPAFSKAFGPRWTNAFPITYSPAGYSDHSISQRFLVLPGQKSRTAGRLAKLLTRHWKRDRRRKADPWHPVLHLGHRHGLGKDIRPVVRTSMPYPHRRHGGR